MTSGPLLGSCLTTYSLGHDTELAIHLAIDACRAKIVLMLLRRLRLSASATLLAGVLASCSSSSSSVAFSCTDAGRDKTLEVAQEIVETIGNARLEGTIGESAHGCDSTPRGFYDFRTFDRDSVTDAFPCREDESVNDDWLLCTATGGPFALPPERAAMATIEVLP